MFDFQPVDDRPNAGARGYGQMWRRLRTMHLNREPMCRHCAQRGIVQAATMVDHIVPLNDGGTHAPDNLQSLCRACHNEKTRLDLKARRQQSSKEQ